LPQKKRQIYCRNTPLTHIPFITTLSPSPPPPPPPPLPPPPPSAGIATDAFVDFVVGHGEIWSAQLLTAGLQQVGVDAVFMDTRDVLVVEPTKDGSSVDLRDDDSNARLDAWFKTHGNHKVVVATGFIAKNTK